MKNSAKKKKAAQNSPRVKQPAAPPIYNIMNQVPLVVYSVAQFCAAHGISKAMYYKLKQQGEGPREMHIGRKKTLITLDAAAAWRRSRERLT